MEKNYNDDNISSLHSLLEHTAALHRYFLDWRYKLIAGYIFIIAAIYYFIFTWVQKPEHYDFEIYLLTCLGGIFISFLFYLIHRRITRLIWKCQNSAYLIEKDLGFCRSGNFIYSKLGVYGNIVDKRIRRWLDHRIFEFDRIKFGLCCEEFNPIRHRGAINLLFILITLTFFYLPFKHHELQSAKKRFEKREIILFERKNDQLNNNRKE